MYKIFLYLPDRHNQCTVWSMIPFLRDQSQCTVRTCHQLLAHGKVVCLFTEVNIEASGHYNYVQLAVCVYIQQVLLWYISSIPSSSLSHHKHTHSCLYMLSSFCIVDRELLLMFPLRCSFCAILWSTPITYCIVHWMSYTQWIQSLADRCTSSRWHTSPDKLGWEGIAPIYWKLLIILFVYRGSNVWPFWIWWWLWDNFPESTCAVH